MNRFDYVLTADADCDLTAEMCDVHGITVIGDAQDAYALWKAMAQKGQSVLHLSVSAAMNPLWRARNAAMAKIAAELPDWHGICLDTTQISAGCGLLALTASRLKENGRSIEECAAALEALKHSVVGLFSARRFTGRALTTIRAETLAQVHPIADLDYDGALKLREKVCGGRALTKKLIRLVCALSAAPSQQTLMIAHRDCKDYAEALGQRICAAAGFRDVDYVNLSLSTGLQGENLTGIFFVGSQRENPADR